MRDVRRYKVGIPHHSKLIYRLLISHLQTNQDGRWEMSVATKLEFPISPKWSNVFGYLIYKQTRIGYGRCRTQLQNSLDRRWEISFFSNVSNFILPFPQKLQTQSAIRMLHNTWISWNEKRVETRCGQSYWSGAERYWSPRIVCLNITVLQ